jgi:hypothetical protein
MKASIAQALNVTLSASGVWLTSTSGHPRSESDRWLFNLSPSATVELRHSSRFSSSVSLGLTPIKTREIFFGKELRL